MGFFGRKKNNTPDEYAKAQRDLNNRTRMNHGSRNAYDRTIFRQLTDEDEVIELAGKIKGGDPVVVNFAKLETEKANMHINFLSGVCFGLEAKIIQIDGKTCLFAKKENFLDGTLNEFINEHITNQ